VDFLLAAFLGPNASTDFVRAVSAAGGGIRMEMVILKKTRIFQSDPLMIRFNVGSTVAT
jgi:hypothetical protein